MASRLPTAENVRRVAPASIPSSRAGPEHFGALEAEAGVEMGAVAVDVLEKQMDRDAETLAKKADVSLSKRIRERLFGNSEGKNPEDASQSGYYYRQKDFAVGDRDLVSGHIQEYYDDLVENMSSRVRGKFDKSALRRLNSAFEGIGRHSIGEKTKVELEASIARELDSRENATANAFGRESTVMMYLNTSTKEAGDRARKSGSKKEAIIAEEKDALSKGHIAVITKMFSTAGGAYKANEWYKKYKNKIRATQHDELEKLLAGAVQSQQLIDHSDDIIQLYNGTHRLQSTYPKAEGDATYAMELARGGRTVGQKAALKKNPDLRTALVTNIKGRLAEIKSIEKDANRELVNAGMENIYNGKPTTEAQRKAIYAEGKSLAMYVLGGTSAFDRKRPGNTTWLDKLAKMKDPELIGVNFNDPTIIRLTGNSWDTWVGKQAKARLRKETGVEVGTSVEGIRAATARLIKRPGEADLFRRKYDDALREISKDKPAGWKFPLDEAQTIANKLMLNMVKESSFPDKHETRFMLSAEQLSAKLDDGEPVWQLNDEISDDMTKTNVSRLANILGTPESKIGALFALQRQRGVPITVNTLTGPLTTLPELYGTDDISPSPTATGSGRSLKSAKSRVHRKMLAQILGIASAKDPNANNVIVLAEGLTSRGKPLTLSVLMKAANQAMSRPN